MTNLGRATEAEIHSQPMIWEDVLRVFRQGADIGLPSPDAYEEIVFTGCGSTYFLAMSAASLLEDHAGIPARALPASEIILSSQDRRPVGPRLLVAISRSGSTTETVEAARIFRERLDADVLAITCHPNSPLGAQASDILSAEPAQESSVVQTRSFTSMLLLSAGWITRHLGEAPAKELRNQGEQLLERHGPFFDRLGSEPDLQRFFILGGGARHGLAREAALKICEMCLDDATAYNTLELRHGPISRVDRESLVIGMIHHEHAQIEAQVLRDASALGARTVALVDHLEGLTLPGADIALEVAGAVPDPWNLALYLPLVHRLALARAREKGLDPDRPSNLSAVIQLSLAG